MTRIGRQHAESYCGKHNVLLRVIVAIGLLLLFSSQCGFASDPLKPAPEAITGDTRVDKLLSEMTLSEKISLIHAWEFLRLEWPMDLPEF